MLISDTLVLCDITVKYFNDAICIFYNESVTTLVTNAISSNIN